MINYIIGTTVAVIVIVTLARKIIKTKKGEQDGCGCSCINCPSNSCCSLKTEDEK